MRTENEMLDLILAFAHAREDIRAVVMNGSRVNPNAPKDPFQDYDIACYVKDVDAFRADLNIPRYFGELIILQLPDDMGDPEPENNGSYAYLMQFMDGNRIDLSFHPLESVDTIQQDSLSLVLLDKDKRIAALPAPGDRGYWPKPPTAKGFGDCCNEFWWVSVYAAKGLWRGELTYAHSMLDGYVRHELMKLMTWYFGINTGFQKSAGKYGKYLNTGLNADEWQLLEQTYADSDAEHTWQALFAMTRLFRQTADRVAQEFGFSYPTQDDERVTAFLQLIYNLPADATDLDQA